MTTSDEARAAAVMGRSALVRACQMTLDTAAVAWRHSIAGSALRTAAAPVTQQTVAGRARLAGAVIAVASVTALALQRLASRPEPLIWIVPAACLIIGLGLLVVCREGAAR